jgi:diaminohydroxyphosphoribosylaminopyrimidine deaminase/5-amino-6-(5-phosphoribosylamino)uracil reductase
LDEEVSWKNLIGTVITPSQAMRLAIEEGKRGWGFVSPNPLVGCTIVDGQHRLLSAGFHERHGEAHAEISAIKNLGDPSMVAGSHVYVTLEPCAHEGGSKKTGSCARRLSELKPQSVTYAVEDPNPLVAGKGAEMLRDAGIECSDLKNKTEIPDRGELQAAAEELAEVFLCNQRKKRPFIGLKVATSADGMMASSSGEPRWLTGQESRKHVHWLRAGYDAILIGRGTFDADDPSLNVRHDDLPNYENRAILLDPSGRSFSKLLNSNLLSSHEPENLFVVVGENASLQGGIDLEVEAAQGLSFLGVNLIEIPIRKDGEFEVDVLLAKLFEAGIHSIMVEGGSRTYGAFVRAGKVDRVHVYKAPMTIGQELGLKWTGNFDEVDFMKHVDLKEAHREKFGVDEYWTAPVRY